MPIIVERRGAVQWLTLNRPRARNAIDSETVQQLRAFFENLRDYSETRVVVLLSLIHISEPTRPY